MHHKRRFGRAKEGNQSQNPPRVLGRFVIKREKIYFQYQPN
jgi:hypothetical protein